MCTVRPREASFFGTEGSLALAPVEHCMLITFYLLGIVKNLFIKINSHKFLNLTRSRESVDKRPLCTPDVKQVFNIVLLNELGNLQMSELPDRQVQIVLKQTIGLSR